MTGPVVSFNPHYNSKYCASVHK